MKKEKEQTFIVLKQFTLDKPYYLGDSIKISNAKVINQLLIQKYIK